MVAAYAALVSLTHVIEQIMERHARSPTFLRKQQRQIESLQQKVSFFQDFLEVYYAESSNIEAEGLESRIAAAAYAAEDIVECHVVDTTLSQAAKNRPNTKKKEKVKFTNHFSQDMQKLIENMDCITRAVTEIKEKSNVKNQQPRDLVLIDSPRSPTTAKDIVVEYCIDDLEQIMDKLSGQASIFQIIVIIGMGGIGKTTLARNVYENQLIVECFAIRAWVTISQEYNLSEMFLVLLDEIGVTSIKREQESYEYHLLGQILHKHLSGRKYLIVMDDIWSIEVCEKLKVFLPDNNNGSRVMVTTRLSNVANGVGFSYLHEMNLLDKNKSWNLLCRKVFGHVNCPSELKRVGKDISKNCKGLPLSIAVIGGLLRKSEMTREHWEYVAKDINQIINSVDNGHWLKILYLSYSHLPIHLKPCFLYMGVYPEDSKIRVSELIKLWVAEGFLKPNKAKSLEEVAEDYLKDLIERNLIMVRERGSVGKLKTCGIHDLLRDLCLKEAQKERFLSVVRVHNHAQCVNYGRRVIFHKDWSNKLDAHQLHRILQSTPLIRSLTCDFQWSSSWARVPSLRLLKVLTVASTSRRNGISRLVNLRYLKCGVLGSASAARSPRCNLWYLQSLILAGDENLIAPHEFWEMPQLRHIISKFPIRLPDPPFDCMDGQDGCVLKNLQTLSCLINFKFTERVVNRIPNIKKLSIMDQGTEMSDYYYLHNLSFLHELQSLNCRAIYFLQNLEFPRSLNKLTLWYCKFDWDDITTKVGSLPHLEKLKLELCYGGKEWNTIEGKFPRLRFLSFFHCDDLECWRADSTHFPLLECLSLTFITRLKEMPDIIGDTLQSIKLLFCGSSLIASAKERIKEQRSLGNEGLRVTYRRARARPR